MRNSYKFILFFFSFILVASTNVNAHAVQLGYCVSCNGDLRIWIEHWHTTENPGATSLSLQLNVNGTITNVSGAPNTSVVNVPSGSLPGCFTPITFFASCPSSANQYNDWVAYDFNNLPCGVPISVTVTSNGSTTVFTEDCANPSPMYPASTGTIVIPCALNQLPDVDTCAGNMVGPFSFPAGNTWTNDNPNIGLPASGSGDIPQFQATTTNNTQTGNIVVTNSCGIATFSVTVYKAPVSNFSANVGCPGQPVTFIDSSTMQGGNINSYQWDFGDGSPVFNGQNPPPHTYPPGGPFNVTLTTSSNNGCTNVMTIPVDPLGGLVADFISPSVCDGNASILTDNSMPAVNILAWAWDWDNDGVVDDTNQNSSFTFSGPGSYNVELLIDGVGGCSDSIIIPVVVNPIPVASFTGTNECLGTATNFNDLSNIASGTITGWQWDFGDLTSTNDTSSLQNPTYIYPASGNYNITLTVTSDSGCTDVFNLSVEVFDIPIANFMPNTACAGANSVFNDLSVLGATDIEFWNWDFDNDAVVDDINQNPVYVFPGGVGSYPVNLNIVDSNGCFHDTTINVNVSAQPTAAFNFTNECYGSATTFTDLSNPNGGTISSWDWDFDNNGTVDDINQNTTNGFPSASSNTVELLVTTILGCVDSITMTVIVNPVPVSDFSVSDECFGSTSVFSDLSGVTTGVITDWAWDFGDGVGSSTLQNPTYNYMAPGTYPVTLMVTTDSLCSNTYIDSAYVFFLPTAAFTVANVCLNKAASFGDNSNGNGGVISTWLWDFDNNGTTDDVNQNTTNSYPIAGNYDVQLIVSTVFGCSDTIVQPVVIYPMPVASFTFLNQCFGVPVPFTNNSTVMSGNITNWDWDFGNSNTSIVQSPAENYASENIYNVELIVTTEYGCRDTINQNIEVWPIPVVDFTPTEVCLNALTQFNDLTTVSNLYTPNNIIQWAWDFGDGIGISINQNPIYTYNIDGIYPANLGVVSNNGCTHDTTINVTVNPLPEVTFGGPTSGCAPNMCVTFVNNTTINTATQPTASINTWLWDFGDGETSSAMNPSHCYQNSSYSVYQDFDVTLTAISDKQCTTTVVEPVMITVYPKPLADFNYSPDKTDIYDREITFSDESIIASIWDWDFGDGISSSTQNPVHVYPDSGSYNVVLYIENMYGCKDTARRTVIIDPVFAIFIPNTITVDGDGINDYFFAKGFGILELHTLIFDRWGTMIYEGYTLDSKWDGTYKGGKITVEDVFVYKIRARDVFDEWHEFLGRITLLK